MQTSQVTNPANVISSPAQAGNKTDAGGSRESFGQVLSREVADRRGGAESAKTDNAGKSAVTQPAATRSKSPESKPAAEGKSKDQADAVTDSSDTATQIPAELLALVANLNQIAAPLAEASEAKPAQDAQIAPDPALALMLTPIVHADQATAQATDTAQFAGGGTQRKSDLTVPADRTATEHSLMGRAGNDKQTPALVIDPKADQSTAAPALDLAAKGQDLLNGAAKPNAVPDFATAAKESAANIAAALQPMQNAALQAAQSHAAHAGEKLTPPVGTPAWDQALGQKVVWMVAGEQQSASLTLNPPDLGPLQVVLNVSNSHASATFTAAQPEVRQALEAALPKLRDMLGEAGIQLGQATVNSGSPNHHSAPDQQTSHARRGFEQGDSRNDTPIRVGRVQPASSGRGLVDTFV